jgi:lysozyme
MILGDAGRALIQSFENCKLYAYQDQRGIWSIGWGHTLGVVPYQTCTQDDADAWFTQDTQAAVNGVMRSLDVAVTQNQFDALVSFTFNVGVGSEAHSTLLALVNQGKFTLAAAQFSFWNHVNGVVDAGLTRRRAAEQALFSGTSTEDSPPGP